MFPKGADEQRFAELLEELEGLTCAFKRSQGALGKGAPSRFERVKELGLSGYLADARKKRRVREQNNAMRAAMQARRAAKGPQAAGEKRWFSPHRIAVYTALFGAYDRVQAPAVRPDNVDYYVLTDQDLGDGCGCSRLSLDAVPEEASTPVLRNRWAKMHPHLLFPDHEYSVYLDSNCWVTGDLTPLIAQLDGFPVAMFPHKNRDCVYDEVDACLMQEKDAPESLERHRRTLLEHGVPRYAGLLEATVIARRHHDERCVRLMEDWWREFNEFSKRDQIGLIDCLWQAGVPVDALATLNRCGVGSTVPACSLFVLMPHNQ